MSKLLINCSMLVPDKQEQKLLTSFLSEFYSINMDQVLNTRSEALEYLNRKHPTVLFLDLEHSDILHFIQKPPYVIGVGTLNGYKKIKNCLGWGFSDFIFSPIKKENVQNVMGKFLNLHEYLVGTQEEDGLAFENRIIYNEPDLKFHTDRDFIFINDRKNGYCRVFCDEILYAESVGNEIRVTKENGGTVYDKKNLKNFIKQLPAHKFLKINRSTVINIHKVNRIDKNNVTINNMVFRVTRTFYKSFSKYFS